MEKILQQVHTYNDTYSIYKVFEDHLDLSKLSNKRLHNIYMSSNLLLKDIIDALIPTDKIPLDLLLLKNLPSKEFINSSFGFEYLSELAQRYCLNYMIEHRMETNLVNVLANRMKTINFGDRHYTNYIDDPLENVNPLLFCCQRNNFDLVKLFVEKFNADIEYSSSVNTFTPIMYSALVGNTDMTSYLYHKGAKLGYIRNVAIAPGIITLINNWETQQQNMSNKQDECEKHNMTNKLDDCDSDINEKYNILKTEFNNLKTEFDKIKRNTEIKLPSLY